MIHEVEVGGRKYYLEFNEMLGDNIDIHKEISIDYTNLTGEGVVAPLVSNELGLMLADAEADVKLKETEIQFYQANFVRDQRAYAAKNAGNYMVVHNGEKITFKVSEKALEKVWCGERDWVTLKNDLAKLESHRDKINVLYWKVKEKADKLQTLLSGVTPSEFTEDVINKALNRYTSKKEVVVNNSTPKGGGLQ